MPTAFILTRTPCSAGVTASAKLVGKLNAKGEIGLEDYARCCQQGEPLECRSSLPLYVGGRTEGRQGQNRADFLYHRWFQKGWKSRRLRPRRTSSDWLEDTTICNGQPIKLKGVNRHENNVKAGHTATREQMEHEVFLMKRGNINHVRNCHYPDAPYWYYLCDKYGIYLEDEAKHREPSVLLWQAESFSLYLQFRNAHIATKHGDGTRYSQPSFCSNLEFG